MSAETQFKLTYGTMFNPPQELHDKFDEAIVKMKANLGDAYGMIDQQRKKRLASVDFDTLPEEIIPDYSQTSPERALSMKQHNARLQDVLNQLAPDDRAAIILRYWYAFSEQEIADTLHLSISAVKSRLFRSRKQIAALISSQEQSGGYAREREYESSTI